MPYLSLSHPACFVLVIALIFALPAFGQESAPEAAPETQPEEMKFVDLEFEPDAYYTSLGLYFALTKTPIPHVGRKTEREIYTTLLTRAYAPRFLVLEASVNPLPYLGTYIRERHGEFYADAQLSGSFNWVRAVTAGFEEPYAVSLFVGNVVDFSVEESKEIKGKGYGGFLFSTGTYHIKDNALIRDDWQEYEWKVKGDQKTLDRKLSWSFRAGAKLHDNPYITDILYLSFRRSRLDYRPVSWSIFNNSGFEYTYDMDRKSYNAVRHYFFVEKKWPSAQRKMAFSLATGFIWESARKYSGPLAAGRETSDFQVILRPNLEF